MNNSKSVDGQIDIHPNLLQSIDKHLNHHFARPIQAYNNEAFALLQNRVGQLPRLIFDTGCGTGDGSRWLAKNNPDALVVGIDQSVHRLSKQRAEEHPNLLLLHCDLIDFWRLCYQHEIQPDHHYLLYPNPWPKKKHYQRRWPAHPILPYILAVGGILELRTNWLTYAQEFAAVLNHNAIQPYLLDTKVNIESFAPTEYLTLFEQKYARSGQTLYKVCKKIARFTCQALEPSSDVNLLDEDK
jgi:tRNA (guanine-N7-)-methyltransferase